MSTAELTLEQEIQNLEDQKLALIANRKRLEKAVKIGELIERLKNQANIQNNVVDDAYYYFDGEDLGKYFKIEHSEDLISDLVQKTYDIDEQDQEFPGVIKRKELKCNFSYLSSYSRATPYRKGSVIKIQSCDIIPQGQYRDVNIVSIAKNMKKIEGERNEKIEEDKKLEGVKITLLEKYKNKFPDEIVDTGIEYKDYGGKETFRINYILIKFKNGSWAKVRFHADTKDGEEYIFDKFKQVPKIKYTLEEVLEDLQK